MAVKMKSIALWRAGTIFFPMDINIDDGMKMKKNVYVVC